MQTKVKKYNGIEYTYSSDWIHYLETEEHWRLYWQQQKLMENYLKPSDRILEIGVGTSFTANYLKSKNYEVTTFDIDDEKKPDIIGNIVEYDWKSEKFSHILAFEVFEHIPYEEFQKALSKLHLVADYMFLSLPLNKRTIFELDIKLPKLKKRHFSLLINKNKITTKNHFWEVGYDKFCDSYI
jgi:2-polyprenyl-3-methyl-5-hydroxy-6-metoxy-1,4-benzoquinol methylase